MPRRSKVARLPKAVKEWLDLALVDGNFEGFCALEAALLEKGYDIGKSSIARYSKEFQERLAKAKNITEQARAMVIAADDDAGALNNALVRVAQERMFDAVMAAEAKDFPKLTQALAQLSRASVAQNKWQAQARRDAFEMAATKAETAAKKAGMSADTVAALRASILGENPNGET